MNERIEFWTLHAAANTSTVKYFIKLAREHVANPDLRESLLIVMRFRLGERRWARHNLIAAA